MRNALLWLHRVLGLTVGFGLAFLGISGALLIFRPELEPRFEPHLHRAAVRASPMASLQSAREAVEARFPSERIDLYFAPKVAGQSAQWWLSPSKKRVFTDPYSGEILGVRTQTGGFWQWLTDAHTHLLNGETGEKVVGWLGLTLLGVALSGLVLWFPRGKFSFRKALIPNLRSNWRGRNYELHRVGGFWLCGFFLVSGTTGAALVFPDSAQLILKPLGLSSKPKVRAARGELMNLDLLVAKANAAMPEGTVTRVSFPSKKNPAVIVRKKTAGEWHPNGQNNISLAPGSGQILAVSKDADAPRGQKMMNARYPLHLGLWGGFVGRALQALAGLSLPFFYFSGLYLWWRMRANRRV